VLCRAKKGKRKREKGKEITATLVERHESLWPPVSFGPVVPYVADDADDAPDACEIYRPADRILSRKVVTGRRIIEDRD
jgi:hypothetical protein